MVNYFGSVEFGYYNQCMQLNSALVGNQLIKVGKKKLPFQAAFLIFCYSSSCTTNPDLSLGSNHVVLGGMMLPESAMSINCFMETG